MKLVSEEIKRADEEIAGLDVRLQEFMLSVPNLPHASVPVGHDATCNVEVRRWGSPPHFDFAPKPHWEVGEGAGILDLARAAKIIGYAFCTLPRLGGAAGEGSGQFLSRRAHAQWIYGIPSAFSGQHGVVDGRRATTEICG